MLDVHLTTITEVTASLRTVNHEASPRRNVSKRPVNDQRLRSDGLERNAMGLLINDAASTRREH